MNGRPLHTSSTLNCDGALDQRLEAIAQRLEDAESRIAQMEAKERIRDTVSQYALFLDMTRHEPAKSITRCPKLQ